MENLITEFNPTGECRVGVDLVVKEWNKKPKKFAILQYDGKYTLVKYGRGSNCAKVEISKGQADEIVKLLGLKEIKESFFRSASSFKSPSFIKSEIERLTSIRMEKYNEVSRIEDIIISYRNSLN
jgi:hypothetical protein